MRRISIVALIVLGTNLGTAPASAAPATTPAIELKTRAAEIAVVIDDKLDPALATSCIAEGRRWVARMQRDAEASRKSDPEFFNSGRRYSYDRRYAFRSLVADRYVSVLRTDGVYTGGAHPNTSIDTILWDRETKKRVSVRAFFKETADNGPVMTALAKLIRRAVAVEKLARWKQAVSDDEKNEPQPSPDTLAETDDWIAKAIEPRLLKLGPLALAPSTVAKKSAGLTVHFSPYDVDAYAAGPYTVFVPWTSFKDYISAEGLAIFGGERPKSDPETDR